MNDALRSEDGSEFAKSIVGEDNTLLRYLRSQDSLPVSTNELERWLKDVVETDRCPQRWEFFGTYAARAKAQVRCMAHTALGWAKKESPGDSLFHIARAVAGAGRGDPPSLARHTNIEAYLREVESHSLWVPAAATVRSLLTDFSNQSDWLGKPACTVELPIGLVGRGTNGIAACVKVERFIGGPDVPVPIHNLRLFGATVCMRGFGLAESTAWCVAKDLSSRTNGSCVVRWGIKLKPDAKHACIDGPSAGGALAVAFAAALDGRQLRKALVLAALSSDGGFSFVNGIDPKVLSAKQTLGVRRFVLWKDKDPSPAARPPVSKHLDATDEVHHFEHAREVYQFLRQPEDELVRRFATHREGWALGEGEWDRDRPTIEPTQLDRYYNTPNRVIRQADENRPSSESHALTAVLDGHPGGRRIIYARRGMGASTALRRYAAERWQRLADLQSDHGSDSLRVCLFLEFDRLGPAGRAANLPELAVEAAIADLDHPAAETFTKTEIDQLRCWLLDRVSHHNAEYELVLDGLDDSAPTQDAWRWLQQQIKALPPGVPVLVTSRTTNADPYRHEPASTDRWRLVGFTPDDARARVNGYFEAVGERDSPANQFLLAALRMPAADWFGRVPAVLTSLCHHFRDCRPLPRLNQTTVMRAALMSYLGGEDPKVSNWLREQACRMTHPAHAIPISLPTDAPIRGLFIRDEDENRRFVSPWLYGYWQASWIAYTARDFDPPTFARSPNVEPVKSRSSRGWRTVWPFLGGLLSPEYAAALLADCRDDPILAATLAAEMDDKVPGVAALRSSLTTWVRDPNREVQWMSVKALGALGHSESVPTLLDVLDDRDQRAEVRKDAALALAEIVSRGGPDPRSRKLSADVRRAFDNWMMQARWSGLRVASASGLTALEGSDHQTSFLRQLKEERSSFEVVRVCAEGLAVIGNQAFQELGQVLVDRSLPAWVRRAAGWALGRRSTNGDGWSQITTWLNGWLAKPSPAEEFVTAGVVLGLGRLADARAVNRLGDLLDSLPQAGGFPLVRAASATALATIGGRAGELVVRLIERQSPNPADDDDLDFLCHLIGAAGRVGNKAACAVIDNLVRASTQPRVQLAAISALAQIGGDDALNSLRKLIQDGQGDECLRRAAVRSLASVRIDNLHKTLDRFFEHELFRNPPSIPLLIEFVDSLRVAAVDNPAELLKDWIDKPQASVIDKWMDHALLVFSEFRSQYRFRRPAGDPRVPHMPTRPDRQQAIRSLFNDTVTRIESLWSEEALLQLGFQTYVEEFVGHTADFSSGTISLPLAPRLLVATEAVRSAGEFVYAVSYTRHDQWQGRRNTDGEEARRSYSDQRQGRQTTDGEEARRSYFDAFVDARGKNRVDARRVYIFKGDAELNAARSKDDYRFSEQLNVGIRLRWLSEDDARTLLGDGGLLNMLSCDGKVVTWQHPVHINDRMDGDLSVAPFWIHKLHHCFLTLWKNAKDLPALHTQPSTLP